MSGLPMALVVREPCLGADIRDGPIILAGKTPEESMAPIRLWPEEPMDEKTW